MSNIQENFFERFFNIKEKGSSIQTEILAGITTFMTMSYILAVNPIILGETGMDMGAVFTATALSSAIATLIMGIFAKLPIGLAPGMGLNAFFAFGVVIGMNYPWQFALTAVFLEGIIFILLTVTNIREAILNCIPPDLKKGIAAGIGLFIAFIGLQTSGIITNHDNTLVTMGLLNNAPSVVAISGFFIAATLLYYKIRGALLYGIIIAAAIGIPLGVTDLSRFDSSKLFEIASLSPTFWQFDFSMVFTSDMALVLIAFLFVDLFDTVGFFAGIEAKIFDKNGQAVNSKQAFMADAVGTTVGAILGTSTVTSYLESVAGVSVGGRTGLTALVIALLFIVSLFLSPIFLSIPKQAIAPILVLVGMSMFSEVVDIDFNDYVISVPVFIILLGMPMSYSIANGIAWGIVTYVVMAIASRRYQNIHPFLAVLAALFVVKFTFG